MLSDIEWTNELVWGARSAYNWPSKRTITIKLYLAFEIVTCYVSKNIFLQYCTGIGGFLVEITSPEETELINSILQDESFFWIGNTAKKTFKLSNVNYKDHQCL